MNNPPSSFKWIWICAGILVLFFLSKYKKSEEYKIEYKTLSVTINNRPYSREETLSDVQNRNVKLPAADDSGESVVVPWSDIKVTTHTITPKELAEAIVSVSQVAANMKSNNMYGHEIAMQAAAKSLENLKPADAKLVIEELQKLQQAKAPSQ